MSRQCVFEGDLPLYIFQISFVYFTLIKNSISVYQQCFPPWMSSACIKWATEHLDGFNSLLTRQLSSVERGTSVWKKCLDIVDEHAAMLTDVGVDFHDIIAKGLVDGDRNRNGDQDRNGDAANVSSGHTKGESESASIKGGSSRKGSLDANATLAAAQARK